VIILRFFPNGEFTKGVSSTKRKKSRSEELSQLLSSKLPPVKERKVIEDIQRKSQEGYWKAGDKFDSVCGSEWMFLDTDTTGCSTFTVKREDGEVFVLSTYLSVDELIRDFEIFPHPLGLSDAPILDKVKIGRKKLEKMTAAMSRNIRNAVYLLEQKYGKHHLSFLTLTLPNLPSEDLQKIAENWDTAVNRLLKWINYRCEKKGYTPEYVYCTEVQKKRYEAGKGYAPHLHIVFNGRLQNRRDWSFTPIMVRRAWGKIIRSYVSASFDSSALENLQSIRKSACSYLGKYLSKGKIKDDFGNSRIDYQLHTQWGGMSRTLSRQIKVCTSRFTDRDEFAEFVHGFTRNLASLHRLGLLKWYCERFIPMGENPQDVQSWGLRVASGLLSIPTLDGGLLRIFEYLATQESTD
jgi:hypothetical protein